MVIFRQTYECALYNVLQINKKDGNYKNVYK